MGMLYMVRKDFKNSKKYLEKAFNLDKNLNKMDAVARDLNNLGSLYVLLNNFKKATLYLENSIKIKEKIRENVKGNVKRDYLANQLYTYQGLIEIHMATNNVRGAFDILEKSRSKQLEEDLSKDKSSSVSVKQAMANIPEDAAVLAYANFDWKHKIIIVLTNKIIKGYVVSDSNFVTNSLKISKAEAIKIKGRTHRGFKTVRSQFINSFDNLRGNQSAGLMEVIHSYRSLLNMEAPPNKKYMNHLSSKLYDLLILPVLSDIKGKKSLIIMPDNILSYIPFETLMDKKGKYLIEKYDISYIQSMGVMHLIKKRDIIERSNNILLCGNPQYDQLYEGLKFEGNEQQFKFLIRQFYSDINQDKSVLEWYKKFGYGNWPQIPATLKEINGIATIVANAKKLAGKDATEENIKKLSINNKLKKYNILHFASHGIVMPEIPELSALVLAQSKNNKSGEDGYLRMNEIKQLKLQAEFVNLSACETGLGKLYGGEGFVGLSQAFLVAGANGVSVSLWQVDDISTGEYMIKMYAHVKHSKSSYMQAISEIKRQFINGKTKGKFKHPYYWAPFVYYGI